MAVAGTDASARTPPDGAPRRRRTAARLTAGVLVSALGVCVISWMLPDEAVHAPLWSQLLGWPSSLLLRSELVQRSLGGGRLDNRVWMRVFVGGAIFGGVIAPTGMSFLFPVFAVLVSSAHLQWTGARAWRACAAMMVLFTAALQVPPHVGWQTTALPGPLNTVATVIVLVVCLSVLVNITVLVGQREAQSAALDAERTTRHDQLLHAATHDALTGLLNRAGLHDHLAQRPAAAPGSGAPPAVTGGTSAGREVLLTDVTVIFVDLDDFKPVNDRYGHAAGDLLLQAAGQRMAGLLRSGDRLARLGGDEFVAVTTTTGPTDASAVVTRFVEALRTPFELGAVVVTISASIGASSSEGPTTLDELLRRADSAMYAAKAGRYRASGTRTPVLHRWSGP